MGRTDFEVSYSCHRVMTQGRLEDTVAPYSDPQTRGFGFGLQGFGFGGLGFRV